MKNEKEFRDNCAAYVLGALEKKEQEEFEHFLQQADKEHLAILREYQDTVMQLPLAVLQQPSDHIRQQILDTVHKRNLYNKQKKSHSEIQLIKLHRSLGLQKPATALATLAAMLLLGLGLLMYSFLLHQHIGEQQETVVELQDELTVKEEYMSILESRQLEFVRLDGAGHTPAAFGKLICDLGRKRALLQLSNLPPLPEDKSYQLWVIKNGHAVNKGRVETRGDRIHSYFLFEEFEVVNESDTEDVLYTITLESEAGKTEPLGVTLMSGSPVLL